MEAISVSQLNRYVKSLIEEDGNLSGIYIKAEISNFKNHYSSGHLYFNLKDKKASVRAVMFSSYAKHLKFTPEEGMAVLVKASVSLYEVDGSFQVYVYDMQPFGEGAVEIALRQLIEKLSTKGYFDESIKKPLPRYPQTIGVITSKTGAAIEDIKRVLSRRYPIALMKFCPALVQGKQAPDSLISAVKTLDGKCDVIIIGRGGGSREDLWAFNDEGLAEAIFTAKTPIISAVGHETDVTICDMVADKRASTPSVAAEIAVPSISEIDESIQNMSMKIRNIGKRAIETNMMHLTTLTSLPVINNPDIFLSNKQRQLDTVSENLNNVRKIYFEKKCLALREKVAVLESLNPMSVLSRGYAAVFSDGKPITSVKQLKINEKFVVQLGDGAVSAVVSEID